MLLKIARLCSYAVLAMSLQSCNTASPLPPAIAAPVEVAPALDLGAGGRPVGQSWSRSVVYGAQGMAATAQPLASQVAVDILKAGGSAVDGAIAANAALGLMEPTGNGIGGDIFFIIWDPASQQLYGYNGSGRSPRRLGLKRLQDKLAAMRASGELPADFTGLPPLGPLPVTVPGTVDGWFAMHQRFGKLPMSQVLAPTVGYAREGFPVSPVVAYYLDRSRRYFNRELQGSPWLDNIQSTWFAGNRAPVAGEIFRNPGLATTLETIGKKGRDSFYKGSLARAMDAYFKRHNMDLDYADFAAHQGEWVQPVSVNYRGYDLFELPPNGQGMAALQMLSILKNVDLGQWSRGSAEVFHYMVEAKRLAFEDAARYYADPAFADIPVQQLLSDAYGRERFALIDPERASPDFSAGDPVLDSDGDTTYLTVADSNGMMVSLIQSNYRGMGSGLAPDGMGFMLQNRGQLFSLDPDHANAYAPGKRPFHTIIPAFVMKGGSPFMSFGLMGGGMQPQGHVQILVNIIDFGMNLQEAGDAARFNHEGGRQPTGLHEDSQGTIYLEPGVSEQTIERLRAMGHKVEVVGDGVMFGGYQAIAIDGKAGVYAGATEMRKDGTVVAY